MSTSHSTATPSNRQPAIEVRVKKGSPERPRRYVTMAGLARYLNKSTATIKRWTKDPAKAFPQPICPPGARALYDLDMIDAWLREQWLAAQ